MRQLDLDLLHTFLVAAESGSFTKASGIVHRTQAAVSMQIKRLEDAVGKPLFRRNTRNLALTEAGEILLSYARQLIALHDEAWVATVQPDVSGYVTIGAPDNYISSLLPPVLRNFSLAYPLISIDVVCAQSAVLIHMLKDNRIDMAFVSRMPGLSGDFMRMEPMVWVASDDSREWNQSPLPVALYDTSSPARTNALKALDAAQIKYRKSYSSPTLLGLLAVVDVGLAVSALAHCSVPQRLRLLGENDGFPPIAPLEIVLVRSVNSQRPACDFLAELIVQTLGTTIH